jgi:hypothetical protein
MRSTFVPAGGLRVRETQVPPMPLGAGVRVVEIDKPLESTLRRAELGGKAFGRGEGGTVVVAVVHDLAELDRLLQVGTRPRFRFVQSRLRHLIIIVDYRPVHQPTNTLLPHPLHSTPNQLYINHITAVPSPSP